MITIKVFTFKMPIKSKFFNIGQDIFIKQITGNQSYLCRGKYKGRGRRISAWVKYSDSNASEFVLKEIEISEAYYKKIMND